MNQTTGSKAPYVVEWRDAFLINIAQVDREHKHLFALVRRLELATVQTTVDELLEYVVTHFTNEQQLMESSGYPAFNEHLKLHEQFASTVADFLSRDNDWTDDRVQELRRFLNTWLIGHIMTHDVRFGMWYGEHHGTDAPKVTAKPALKVGSKAPYVVEWRDGFRVNIAQVDREHKHLFALIKRLELATVQTTVDELLDYVVTHFTNEQQLMENSGYPAFNEHLKLHEQFASSVAEFLSRDNDWTDDRVQELRRFLNKWLIGHIMTHDLRFGMWYRDHHGTDAPEVTAKPAKKVGWFDRLLGRG